MKIKILKLPLFGFLLLTIIGCSTSKLPETRSPEEIFNQGMKYFKNEDYKEAKMMFDVIKLQYPASQWADDAQFYLAETNFAQKEFILASFNYNLVRRLYPSSEFVKISLFKSALCYFELSPTYDRDQEYTKKGIQSFQEFQHLYPKDSLYAESGKYISELRNKLAHREYFTAGLYLKMDNPESALIYFDTVINDYDDTEYYEMAYFGKIDILAKFGKKDEALNLIDLYKKNFKNGKYLSNLETIEKTLKNK